LLSVPTANERLSYSPAHSQPAAGRSSSERVHSVSARLATSISAARVGSVCLSLIALCSAGGCSNNPFPRQDATTKVRYQSGELKMRTLDPAVSYSAGTSAEILSAVYEPLLEYHYLKRPYQLIPGIAKAIPKAQVHANGQVSYAFDLREGIMYHPDPCFQLSHQANNTREAVAADIAFQLKRIADVELASPVLTQFKNIVGVTEFSEALKTRRRTDPAFARLPVTEQYDALGPIAGVQVAGPHRLALVLQQPYPQILYWLALYFSAPVPWEAVVYYDGQNGRPFFKDHPVGTGPYYVAKVDKGFRLVLSRNEGWYGRVHPEWKAPATIYPTEGEAGDVALGYLDEARKGTPLAFIERFEFRKDPEATSSFGKFMQGYYDTSGVSQDRFDTIIQHSGLSEDMATRGIRLTRSSSPSIFYMGFNMNDDRVGYPAGERGRRLRQAMNLAIDWVEYGRLFMNGLGVPAQSPLPPGIFGYDPDYKNPYRQPDIERAKALLVEAGYPGGIDPATGNALQISMDVRGTDANSTMSHRFYINSWRKIGLDVQLRATDSSQRERKIRSGSYQIFDWGWVADYPDPENFLFLLWSGMGRAEHNGPNLANFKDARYDELFLKMRELDNGDERYRLVQEMVAIAAEECPWLPLYHGEGYSLSHGWVKASKPMGLMAPTYKYQDIDPAQRDAYQKANNDPIRWPLYVIMVMLVATVAPAISTFFKERQ